LINQNNKLIHQNLTKHKKNISFNINDIFLLYNISKIMTINQSDTINFTEKWFDWAKYIQLQTNQIKERISKFSGRLYLEIGWKFMYDSHASRVLPWFLPESKKTIFSTFKDSAEILFCINAKDIINNRQLTNEDIIYTDYVLNMLKEITKWIKIKPQIVINMINKNEQSTKVENFYNRLKELKYKVNRRYFIKKYTDSNIVLSDKGFWQDDFIKLKKNLILVTGAASNSWKMSTCLWQIYLDKQNNIKSGYAKYETFPIRNLPLNHPINLAYEAATADIGDFNCIDIYHQKAYGQHSVNYNRDVETFELVMSIAKKIVNHKNYMRTYKSPTDMWISTAWFAITNDNIVSQACLQEIQRRKARYQQMIDRQNWDIKRVKNCKKLETKCKEYIKTNF